MRLVLELIMSDRLVTIAQFADSIEASMAKQVLADHGIESFLAGEYAANTIPGVAVELWTLESKSAQAVEILESKNNEEQ